MRVTTFALILAALTVPALPALAQDDVKVTLDQAKILRLEGPAATIIIGNPSIADATMQDNRTLVVTGKSYGATNMIILDADGETVAEHQVVVEGPSYAVVTVFKGPTRLSYSCQPVCQPTLVPGDRDDYFGQTASQPERRNGQATGVPAQSSTGAQ